LKSLAELTRVAGKHAALDREELAQEAPAAETAIEANGTDRKPGIPGQPDAAQVNMNKKKAELSTQEMAAARMYL
jgi:hypothetical protein